MILTMRKVAIHLSECNFGVIHEVIQDTIIPGRTIFSLQSPSLLHQHSTVFPELSYFQASTAAPKAIVDFLQFSRSGYLDETPTHLLGHKQPNGLSGNIQLVGDGQGNAVGCRSGKQLYLGEGKSGSEGVRGVACH